MAHLSKQEQDNLPESEFAFPGERKEPLVDAKHVRDALARFDQVEGVTNGERDEAWRRIRQAAERFGIELRERGWRELFTRNNRPIPEE